MDKEGKCIRDLELETTISLLTGNLFSTTAVYIFIALVLK